MKKQIKAIILDIDGVIVGEKIGFNSPEPNRRVVDKLRELGGGCKIILCTAKPHFAIRSIIDAAGLNNPHITDGGGVLINPMTNEIISQHNLQLSEARKILKMCLAQNFYVECYTNKNYIVQRNQVCDITTKHNHILQAEPEVVDDILKINQKITKIMPVVNSKSEIDIFMKHYNELNADLTMNWSIHPIALPLQFGIITAKGISKKQGMLDILARLGISPDNALAIGDSLSDWQFMESCKYIGTMQNAGQALKDLVKTKGAGNYFIGGHVDENGVIPIFNYFLKTTY